MASTCLSLSALVGAAHLKVNFFGSEATVKLLRQIVTRIRCAYCGLDHKLIVKVFEGKNQELVISVEAASDGCDVLNNLLQ